MTKPNETKVFKPVYNSYKEMVEQIPYGSYSVEHIDGKCYVKPSYGE